MRIGLFYLLDFSIYMCYYKNIENTITFALANKEEIYEIIESI